VMGFANRGTFNEDTYAQPRLSHRKSRLAKSMTALETSHTGNDMACCVVLTGMILESRFSSAPNIEAAVRTCYSESIDCAIWKEESLGYRYASWRHDHDAYA
jgi:hypothetical protein